VRTAREAAEDRRAFAQKYPGAVVGNLSTTTLDCLEAVRFTWTAPVLGENREIFLHDGFWLYTMEGQVMNTNLPTQDIPATWSDIEAMIATFHRTSEEGRMKP
jgi:hypothetical protein